LAIPYIGQLMRRELVWAGIIGISFGLIIAFGAWRISSTKRTSPGSSATPLPSPTTSEFKITLDKPENNDVVTENSITVSGITKPLAWITVSGDKGDYIIQSDEHGGFTQDVDLSSGVNQIKVTGFDPKGGQAIQKVLIVYSSSFEVLAVPTPLPGDNSTESAIRAKVQQKVAEALNKPKAYLGVVTDIADATIQLKTADSEIKQVSTDSRTPTVVNIKGTNNKAVKLTDIAIGDFIVAMGYLNSSSVLSAQRILITDPVTESKIDSFYGKVSDTSTKLITVENLKDGKTSTVTPGTKTIVETYNQGQFLPSKIAGINSGDVLIYVLDSNPDTPTIRSIFVVQKPSV